MKRKYINYGGILDFEPNFLTTEQADSLFEFLNLNVRWEQKYYSNFRTGAKAPQPRQTAWYADNSTMAYSYSGITQEVQPWFPELLELKSKIETLTGANYNSVLLNLYKDGSNSIGAHADDEKELGDNPNIASVSLGGTRTFIISNYKKDFTWDEPTNISLAEGNQFHYELSHGSLLVMSGATQRYWKHEIRKTTAPAKPRINLTFRYFKV